MVFASLVMPEPVVRGFREAGFVTATPIQEAVLPLALRGKDVAGQSQTGTGKTAAFLIAAFTRLLRSPAPSTPAGARATSKLALAPARGPVHLSMTEKSSLRGAKAVPTLPMDRA